MKHSISDNTTNHIIITGPTGSGKSQWIHHFTSQLQQWGYSFEVTGNRLKEPSPQELSKPSKARFKFWHCAKLPNQTDQTLTIQFPILFGASDLCNAINGCAHEEIVGHEIVRLKQPLSKK